MKRKIFFFYSVIVISGLITFGLYGQQPLSKSFDIRSENSKPKILKLFVDHNGQLYAGTDNGIFTFDGITFTKISVSPGSQSSVSSLFEDDKFNLWVGYEDGSISIVANSNGRSFKPEEGLPKVPISAFAEDDDGRIYFSTKGEGVYCIDNNHLYNFNTGDGLSDDFCYAMVKIPGNRICVGTDAGLNFISFDRGKKKISVFGTSEGLADDIVRTLALEKDGILWIGMQENGIAKYDCLKNKLVTFEGEGKWKFGQINNILKVDNVLWVSTEEKGIVVVNENGVASIQNLQIAESTKLNDLITDHENNVWIAEAAHLVRTSGNKISFLSQIDNKQLNFIHCIICDKKGDIWFSPDEQLGHIYKAGDGKLKYREYKVIDKKSDLVTLYFDPYGYLWIGTLGAGVYRFNTITGNVRKVSETTNVESSSILSINGTGDIVWVTGFNSVKKFIIAANGNSDNAKIEIAPSFTDNDLMSDYVYSVFIDSKKNTWFATDGSGVFSYDGKTLKNVSVSENAVHSFTEDNKGRIWYSTADAGLQYIDSNQSIHMFQTKDGLSDPSPTSILTTKTGNIIIVNNNGFDILNPETKNIIYHSSEENLADLNCDLNSITMSGDSSVWIGTERGILHYRPSSDLKMERPKIILRSVTVFPEAVDFRSKKLFESDENNFRFDYDGIWYIDPQRINYYFMLEGYSTKWENTKDHTVLFPKLPPGKYVFKIRASLNENYADSEVASYEFQILPPVWQRWWFRIVSSALIVLLILMIVRRREDRLRKFDRLQKEKIEFQFETLKSQVNPHFLFNSFNTLISVIEETPKEAVEYVERLSEFFRNIIMYRDKNQISLSEEIDLLENYIFIQKKRFGDNLRCEVTIDKSTRMSKSVAPLTLQMLAENAIKHNSVSKESPLVIQVVSENGKMKVSNNINPKIKKEKSAGFGLENIRNRYQLLTEEKVEIIITENIFTVVIPFINSKTWTS